MFFKWMISSLNNEKVLFLYLQNNYEFAKELFLKDNNRKITDIINEFIERNNIIYTGNKVYIVSNNLVIGSAMINNNNANIKQYVDIDKIFNEELEIIDIADKKEENAIQQKNIEEIERRYILMNANYDLERETIKTILTIIHSNLVLEVKKTGYIKDIGNYLWNNKKNYNSAKDYIDMINTIIQEINETIILTNNTHKKIDFNAENNFIERINIMVKTGYNFKQIINHFYPNSVVIQTNKQS